MNTMMKKVCMGGMLLAGMSVANAAENGYFTQYEKEMFGTARDVSGVKLTVVPEKEDSIYKCGETARLAVSAADKDGAPLESGVVKVRVWAPNRDDLLYFRDLADGNPFTVELTSDVPAFVTCEVSMEGNGRKVAALGAAGFDPREILPVQTLPDDFMDFWLSAREEARKIPLDAQLNKVEALSDELATTYSISIANINNTRMYGYICLPNKPGKYPAFLAIPGAGAGFISVPAEFPRGETIAMTLNVHDFEVEASTCEQLYQELNKNGVYSRKGVEFRETYYFYRTIVGLMRGVDYLTGRPDWDGKHLLVWGSSQGGALTLAISGLCSDVVSAATVNVPAMCDFAAHKADRNPAWPFIWERDADNRLLVDKHADVLRYYDSVNFARHIKCPITFGVGLVDKVCQPAGIFSAYNVVQGEKSIWVSPWMGHDFDPEYTKFRIEFIKDHFKQ